MTANQQWWMWTNQVVPDFDPPTGDEVFLEDFETGNLDDYDDAGGVIDPTLWTLVGGTPYGAHTLNYLGRVGSATSAILRTLPAPLTFRRIEGKFKLLAGAVDDAANLSLLNESTGVLAFNPRREFAFDGTQRAEFTFASTKFFIGEGPLEIGVWHKFVLATSDTPGETTIKITRLSDNTEVSASNLNPALGYGAFTFNKLQFNDDALLGSSATQWDDIRCYNE